MTDTNKLKMRKYASTLPEAKTIYKAKTGMDWDVLNKHYSILIYDGKGKRAGKHRYFIGTNIEWLNQ